VSVDKADVIDLVVQDPKTGEVMLIMVETRDWRAAPEAIEQLHAKFQLYAQYVMSGSMAQEYPDMAKSPVSIRLDHFAPMVDRVAAALRQWAGRLSSVPVGVSSHRLYWNRLVSLLRKILPALRKCDTVRWIAEPASAEPLLTRVQFTEEIAAVLRSGIPKGEVQVIGELQLKIIAPNKVESAGYLENAYTQYMLASDQKDSIINKYATSLVETAGCVSQPIDRSRIVPILKDNAWVEEINQNLKARGKEKAVASVHEPYNEELTIVYAQDTPRNVQYLTTEHLGELGLELKELRPLACTNLKRLLPEPDIQVDNGIYRIKAGGDYDASLILLEDFWNFAKIDVDGELVAAVPARDFLLVTGSQDTVGMTRLKQLAQSIASKAPYRLTPKLFVRRHDRFVPFL
jgi:uncharacterized protein YtpQ (UPF0354 family)